jgi:hypothetical protein
MAAALSGRRHWGALVPWGALALCAGLLTGCPQKTTEEPPAPPPVATPAGGTAPIGQPPVVVAPQPGADPDQVVPPQPKPKNQGEAWDAAATKQTHWRISLAKAFKQKAEREALLKPFAEPSTQLLRLIAFARAFPSYDPALSHTARLDHQLKRLYSTDTFLGSTPLKPKTPAAFALLVLADAKVLSQARFVLTPKGWESPRQGLADGSYPGLRARKLLEGVVLARDGRWDEATPLLLAAFRAEGAAVSDATDDDMIKRAWAHFSEALDRPDSSAEVFQTALDRWSGAFTRKDLKGPATKNKKG